MTREQLQTDGSLAKIVRTVTTTLFALVIVRLIYLSSQETSGLFADRFRASIVASDGTTIAAPTSSGCGALVPTDKAFEAPVRWIERLIPHDLAQRRHVSTTIDARAQQRVHRIVSLQRRDTDADFIVALVIDPRSGAIRAAAIEAAPTIRQSHATLLFGTYFEPGSTLKPLVIAAAIENELLELDELFSQRGQEISVRQILAHSNNWGALEIASRLGTDTTLAWLAKFGVIGQRRGMASGAYGLDALVFGSSVVTLPVQVLAANAMVVNGGRHITPHLVDSNELRRDGVRVISENTSSQMRGLMLAVTEFGTARSIRNEMWPIIGKTGTIGRRDCEQQRDLAWFVGFTPPHAPSVGVLVLVQGPPHEVSGGTEAAVVAYAVLQSVRDLY